MSKPILAYWEIRGLAQPARLLLEYTGTDFEDKKYVCGPAPTYDKSCWTDTKQSLGLNFPNLPYYIDGDVKVTQSNAIMRYIARKHNLVGSSEAEIVRLDMMENEAMDFRNGLVRLCYNPDFENLKKPYMESLGAKLKSFSKFLGDYKFFAGDNLTFVDFIMYELLDQHLCLDPTCLGETKNLKEFQKRFEKLEKIKQYLASDRFMKKPLNNKMAKFGYE